MPTIAQVYALRWGECVTSQPYQEIVSVTVDIGLAGLC